MTVSEKVKNAYLEAEPKIDHLTSANFKSTIASGDHLIFYGASWCGHCQKLTPVWLQVQESKKSKNLGNINLAKVECTENQDLCVGIDGYPSIQLFHNGEKTQEFDFREYEPLLQKVIELNEKLVPTSNAFEKLVELAKVETQPDTTMNPNGEVVYLTDATFDDRLKGPWLIMFHAPWCGHCKTLSPIYTELAPRLRHRVNIGKVDCTVHKRICNQYEIRGFPTVKFLDGDTVVEFSGERSLSRLEDFALSFVGKPSFEVVKADSLTDIIDTSDVAAVLVFDGDEATLQMAVSIAKLIKNKIKMYICPEAKGYEKLRLESVPNSPTLVIYTDNGIHKEKYTGTFVDTIPNKSFIKNWIIERKNPLVPILETHNQAELTSSDILLIAVVDPDGVIGKKAVQDLKVIANEYKKQYPATSVKFSWLDGMKYASYVNHVYGIQVYSLPRLVITKPKDELYFTTHVDGKEYTIESTLIQAIQDVMDGKATVLVIN
jgi:protein disulfide-isomerase-like protein